MYKANHGNNMRRKGNSDVYKYRYEVEAPTSARHWAVANFAHPLRRH
jgi:hypothetical protein